MIAWELGKSDDGEEWGDQGPGPLDWLPDYELQDIIQTLHQRKWEVQLVVPLWLIYGAVCGFVFCLVERWMGLCAALPWLATAYWLVLRVLEIVSLQGRLRAAEAAGLGVLPDADDPRIREVNWWQLRKAFDAMYNLSDPHRDPGGPLTGSPWALLRHRSLLIPVFRKHRGERTLRPQQLGRIAAYCHLVETSERAQAPYGIVLFAGSDDAMIVPNTDDQRRLLHEGVRDLQQMLSGVQAGDLPPAPQDNRCAGCPLGKPRVHQPGQTDQHLQVLPGAFTPRTGRDGRRYHSVCGDRFEWVPPHIDAEERQLPPRA